MFAKKERGYRLSDRLSFATFVYSLYFRILEFYFSCRLCNYLRMPRTTDIFRNPLKRFLKKYLRIRSIKDNIKQWSQKNLQSILVLWCTKKGLVYIFILLGCFVCWVVSNKQLKTYNIYILREIYFRLTWVSNINSKPWFGFCKGNEKHNW